jgi:hypothetical protein
MEVSWVSLFRLALAVKELRIERPAMHLVRTAEQRFDVSDLLDSTSRLEKSRTSFRFAVSKLQLNDGTVYFGDKVLGGQYTIEQVQIDIPFISSLPADVEIAVEPFLRMVIDGSPLHIRMKATPFSMLPASVVDLTLRQFDLSRYRSSLLQVQPDTAESAPESVWQYRIASLALDNSEARLEGVAALSPIDLVVAPLHLHLKNLSRDLNAPIGLDLDGALNRQGRVNVTGDDSIDSRLRATGAEAWRHSCLALLAEACGKAGQIVEGLAALAEALALVDKGGERFYEAELDRL